jgi:6-phosphogluconolactonase
VHHDVDQFADATSLATAAATYVSDLATRCVEDRGAFHFAVSGGTTPWAMIRALTATSIPWPQVTLYQVDERVAPNGDPARNLTGLRTALGSASPTIVAMGVTDSDLDAAARTYAASLPERFDLVHLGLGPDGHTASLIPGDPVLDVTDRLVALTNPYQGHRRMTFTYRALRRAIEFLWLVTGTDKHTALTQLLSGDASIPAGRVDGVASRVMADHAAVIG